MDLIQTTNTREADAYTGVVSTPAMNELDSLADRETTLRDELKAAMICGDVPNIVDARQELQTLPILRRAIELKTLREKLTSIEKRFIDNANEETSLVELRNAIDDRLQPLIDQIEEIQTEVNRHQFAISLVLSERTSLHQERRETKARIVTIEKEITEEANNG